MEEEGHSFLDGLRQFNVLPIMQEGNLPSCMFLSRRFSICVNELTLLVCCLRETVPRERRHNDLKDVTLVPTVTAGVDQHGNYL